MGRNRNGKYNASNLLAMTAATALKSVAMTTFLFRSVSPGQNHTHQKAAITKPPLAKGLTASDRAVRSKVREWWAN
jgi:hypothetical protein